MRPPFTSLPNASTIRALVLAFSGLTAGFAQEPGVTIPNIPDGIAAEVAALFPDAAKCDLYDFNTVTQLEASFAAQQRIKQIGELADWALLQTYERHSDPGMRRAILRLSVFNYKLAPYGLQLTRETIRSSTKNPQDDALFRAALDAAEYVRIWGNARDLELFEELEGNRRKAGKTDGRLVSERMVLLQSRVSKGLKEGEPDESLHIKYSPFHLRGLKPEHMENWRKLVAFHEERRSHPPQPLDGSTMSPPPADGAAAVVNAESPTPIENVTPTIAARTSSRWPFIPEAAFTTAALILVLLSWRRCRPSARLK